MDIQVQEQLEQVRVLLYVAIGITGFMLVWSIIRLITCPCRTFVCVRDWCSCFLRCLTWPCRQTAPEPISSSDSEEGAGLIDATL